MHNARWVVTWHAEDIVQVPGNSELLLVDWGPTTASQVLEEPRHSALLCLPIA